jgi:type IV pilus assembly protein PilY1
MSEGEFPDWGNPIAEMMYEGLRYYAGKATPTTDFHSATMTEDDALGLPNASWDDPYATHDYCARPFMLVLSDINPTYDSDQLPGSYFGSAPSPNDLSSLDVDTIADTIFSAEGLAGSYYIGQEQSDYDGSCAPKPASGFGDLRGLCPEEPSKCAYLCCRAGLTTSKDRSPHRR